MPKPSYESSPGLRLYSTAAYVVLCLLAIGIGCASAKNLIFTTIHETGKSFDTRSVPTTPEWQTQPSGTAEVLLGVSFTDINKGYAVGTNGVIRVTSDGGSTWTAQASGTSRFLRDVYFSDATHGVIVGESGLILKTTDGTTWIQQTSGTIEHLVHVHFLNNSVGMASGQGGVILKTTDGGVTWTVQSSGTNVELPGVYLMDVNTAIAVGFAGTILRTTNGGTSWASVSVPGFTFDLRSVHFSGTTGVAVSMGGRILKSTDGGQSWASVSSGTSNNLFAVQFRNASTVYAVGNARVLVSIDAGSSWSPATTAPFGSDLYGVVFNATKGWTVGQNGLILHAADLPAATTVQFEGGNYTVTEGCVAAIITLTRTGDATGTTTVDFLCSDGSALQRSDYSIASGTLTFTPNQTIGTFRVSATEDAYVESNETLNVTLNNVTGGSLGAQNTATVTIEDNDTVNPPMAQPIDDTATFVCQHYHDFLSREPDAGGFDFWKGQITQCGADQACIRIKRLDVSNAFFFELEFQQTGAYVFRLYRAAYGNDQPFPNPSTSDPAEARKLPSYGVFSRDRAKVIGGSSLSAKQADLANAFVRRSEFLVKYPATLVTAEQFVDALLATIQTDLEVNLSSQRDALIALYQNSGGRGAVMYRLADDNAQTNPVNNRPLIDAEYNRAFVTTQYFGYLRRNPDIGGLLFWLGQVNSAPLRDVAKQHAMVCSFITSAEYQLRFSSVLTHSNNECE